MKETILISLSVLLLTGIITKGIKIWRNENEKV